MSDEIADLKSALARKQEDYETCERENDNLRDALAWAAQRLNAQDKDRLERYLSRSLDDGGVTGTQHEDDLHDVASLLKKLVAHVEPLTDDHSFLKNAANMWFGRLDALLNQAREHEPKHPLMRRVGGNPNVFEIVRKAP